MYPPEIGTTAEDMVLERWVEQAVQMQEEALEALARDRNCPSPTEKVVATGRTWSHALDALRWDRDEVLVVGSSATANFVSRLFLGSSATKIIRHSPVPVIVVP